MEIAVQRMSWWERRMGLQSQAAAVETQRKTAYRYSHFFFLKGFLHAYVSCRGSLPPPPQIWLIHLCITVHCSPQHPLDQITGPLIQLDQFSIMISDHYWSGPVPRNLGRLIYLILTTSHRDIYF